MQEISDFSKYDPQTGKILSCGTLMLSCKSHYEPCILVRGDFATQYVDVNTLQLVDMPPKPSEFYDFDYVIKEWVLNTEKAIAVNKQKRNTLLQESDWTQMPDVDLTAEQKESWKVYRQELRDMTNEMLINGDFPVKPS